MRKDYIEHGGLWIHRDDVQPLRDAGLDSFDALMAAPGQASLGKKGLASWRQRIVMNVAGRTLYLKRYNRPPVKEQLRQRLAGFSATAAIEWHWLGRVAELGIACPRIVAFGTRCRGGVEGQSLLLTEAIAGQSLEKWMPRQIESRLNDRAFKLRLIAAAADLVARLHGAGLFHRDLYLAHLFIDDPHADSVHAADSPGPALALIDLQRIIQPRLSRRRWRIKDLASLNYSTPLKAATRADRLRWFKQYRGIRRLMSADRALLRAITAKTRRIARHSTKHRLG